MLKVECVIGVQIILMMFVYNMKRNYLMRPLTENELKNVSGALYESVNTNCVLASGAMIVSAFGGPIGLISTGLAAIGACATSSSSSSASASAGNGS
jgi:hypothetical protein